MSAVINSLKVASNLSPESKDKLTEIENVVTIQRQQSTEGSLYGLIGHTRTTGKSEQHAPKYTNLNMLSDLSEIGDMCKIELDKKIILPIDDLESEKCDLDQALYLVGLLRDLTYFGSGEGGAGSPHAFRLGMKAQPSPYLRSNFKQ